ncbi:MAG: HAD-IIIA family hydrolase [Lentisphaeria bacterium]|nr:HAD-IIIA family hydrolase [Lentisphaeria bacterium]
MRPRAAVFLDRDGTLIEDVGALRDPADIRIFPDTLSALRLLRSRFMLFVVTNQCWVGEGLLSHAEVDAVHRALDGLLRAGGVRIAAWYVCPHARGTHCACRKPEPALLHRAAREHNIRLDASLIIGDHPSDVLTGCADGVRGVYVLTGHGEKHREGVPAGTPVFRDLGEAAHWIDGIARAEL